MSRVALTYKDYAALPNDGQRYQILDGELCVTPAPNPLHQELSMRLASLLHIHVTTHGLGEVYAAPIDVILSEEPSSTTIVQPDIVFVANDRLDRISRRAVDGAPTLAIEILSPSTASLDAGGRRALPRAFPRRSLALTCRFVSRVRNRAHVRADATVNHLVRTTWSALVRIDWGILST
jgi:hypothetical protein